METLPTVAKNVHYPCKKCDADRYHRVLTHLSPTEAKLECEVCGSKKKLTIGKKMATKKAKAKTKKKSTRKAKVTHTDNWRELTEKFSDIPPQVYSIRGNFPADTVIDHPSFGLGVVMESLTNKIEVTFEEGMKTLMHRRDT